MQVTVLLFGEQAATAGRSSVAVELSGAAKASDVLRQLGEQVPMLRPSLGTARVAVNHAFAGPDQVLKPGDEVAIIGLVGGG